MNMVQAWLDYPEPYHAERIPEYLSDQKVRMTMAKPAPCQRCLEVPDADYYFTNRLDNPWPFEQATVALCFSCMVQVVMEMAEAYRAAVAMLEAKPEPGALEAVEAAEGPVEPVRIEPKSKSRKAPAPEAVNVPETATEKEGDSVDHR